MENPIMELLLNSNRSQTNNQFATNSIETVRELAQQIKTSRDPYSLMTNLVCQNPDISRCMKQNNMNPVAAFYDLAKCRGADPNAILEQARSLFKQ